MPYWVGKMQEFWISGVFLSKTCSATSRFGVDRYLEESVSHRVTISISLQKIDHSLTLIINFWDIVKIIRVRTRNIGEQA
jgi:hypothetical protein